jgi:hypothetical protein
MDNSREGSALSIISRQDARPCLRQGTPRRKKKRMQKAPDQEFTLSPKEWINGGFA